MTKHQNSHTSNYVSLENYTHSNPSGWTGVSGNRMPVRSKTDTRMSQMFAPHLSATPNKSDTVRAYTAPHIAARNRQWPVDGRR